MSQAPPARRDGAPGHRRSAGPANPGRHVILTSGTTGRPKDVARTTGGLESVVALLSGLPLRVRENHLIAAPMFHAWGWLNMILTMLLSSTVVMTRRFDAERTLALVEQHRCEVLVAVPAMLRRIMDLPVATRRRYDTACLRVVAVSGSAMSPSLATAFMDEFGDILVQPVRLDGGRVRDRRRPGRPPRRPGTAGRPLPMVRVRVLDGAGRDAARGEPGVIEVSSRDAVRVDPSGRAGGPCAPVTWAGSTRPAVSSSRPARTTWSSSAARTSSPWRWKASRATSGHRRGGRGRSGRSRPRTGAGAHVVARRGARVTATALRQWCRAHLASFQVPRRFVFHQDLPHGETGKVLKRSLTG